MPLACEYVALAGDGTCVVVRPRKAGPRESSTSCSSSRSIGSQVLVFMDEEIRELLYTSPLGASDGTSSATFKLSDHRLPVLASAVRHAYCALYEPISDAVYFTANDGNTILRLDASNAVGLVAGREGQSGHRDGCGNDAQLNRVRAMAADGKGAVYVAEEKHIRLLDVLSGEVTTLQGSEPPAFRWNGLSYDPSSDVLVAATRHAICHITPPVIGGGASAALPAAALPPKLIAGSWHEAGDGEDGLGTAARFKTIKSILAGAGGSLYIGDGDSLRVMDAAGAVSTAVGLGTRSDTLWQVALLPGGELTFSNLSDRDAVAIVTGGGFQPCSDALVGRLPPQSASSSALNTGPDLAELLATTLTTGLFNGNTSSSSSSNPLACAVITIRVGGAGRPPPLHKAFVAHRAVLAVHSEYFKRLVAAGGGFGDSGAAEVTLADDEPEAFGRLLGFMYTGILRELPEELLHTVSELAGRLLMSAACMEQLRRQLMAAVTPGSVIGELCWAERHAMTELVPRLREYLLRHRREVAAAPQAREQMAALIAALPALATDLMLDAFAK